MQAKTRMNVYFEPALLKQVEALALRRNVSKSAVIEAAVASFLSEDSAERLEAVFARRMDRLGRQIDCMDQDLAILGETVSLFIRFWLTITPPRRRLSVSFSSYHVSLLLLGPRKSRHAAATMQPNRRTWVPDAMTGCVERCLTPVQSSTALVAITGPTVPSAPFESRSFSSSPKVASRDGRISRRLGTPTAADRFPAMPTSLSQLLEDSFQIAWEYLERTDELGDGTVASRFLSDTIEKMIRSGQRSRLGLSNRAISAYLRFTANGATGPELRARTSA